MAPCFAPRPGPVTTPWHMGGDEIEPMSVDCPEFVRTEPCRAFYIAWHDWRGSDPVPRRRAVRLEDIRTYLSHVMVLEVRSED